MNCQRSTDDLYDRPGFLIRRAHQIAVSLFLEETAELRVTTSQYCILFLLSHRSKLDQITVARLLGLDRSTTAMVVKSLEGAALIARGRNKIDKRRQNLELTPAGRALLAKLDRPASSAVRRLLQPFSPAERVTLLKLLKKLTDAFNESARVPLLPR